MELLIVFIIFIVCMAASLLLDLSMLLPLAVGFCLFTGLAMRRGYTLKAVLRFAGTSVKESFIVIWIILLIGCLTGLWRQSGTIAYFVSLGISLIPPRMFLLASFLLASAMSFALGTSFGVTATAGVILISIARAGGVDPILAAGAILSGVYVGDRGSPAASSGNLVAVLTDTDMRRNVREMLKCSAVPFLLCCAVYALLSLRSPMGSVDSETLSLLDAEFLLHWLCLLPAILMIVLPFCRVRIRLSMTVSLVCAFLLSVFVQGEPVSACVRAMVLGYSAENSALEDTISGGGIVSMLEVSGILLISGSYGGIFRGTGMLSPVSRYLKAASDRLGRFPVMLLLGIGTSSLFCNQTISAIMESQLSDDLYGRDEAERYAKMLDMENSVILLAGLVPWCIANSVPRAMLGVDVRATFTAFYLWLVPLYWLLRSKIHSSSAKR